jgi:hypothetical protein
MPIIRNNSSQSEIIVHWLIMLTAVCFPLYAVDFLRIHPGNIELALPMITTALIIPVGILGHRTIINWARPFVGLWLLLAGFYLWHILRLHDLQYPALAVHEMMKLATGLVFFWCITTYFPRENGALERFWAYVLWGSTALMAFLIYKYAVVFEVPFLNKFLILAEDPALERMGKNHPAWYLAAVLPYAIFYGWQSHLNVFIKWIPAFILLFALMYTQSRGAWLAFILGMGVSWLSILSVDKRAAIRALCIGALGLSVFIVLSLMFSYVLVDLSEIPLRMLSIVQPESISDSMSYLGKHSYERRWGIVLEALHEIHLSPLIGSGFTNISGHFSTHNDHLNIVAELGFFGETLFIGIFAMILWIYGSFRGISQSQAHWTAIAGRGSLAALIVLTLFLNSYTSPFFWSVVALYCISNTSRRSGAMS